MIKFTFVAAIAVACGINVFNAQKSETLSGLTSANLEALASYDASVLGCNTYCQPDLRFTCQLVWSDGTELVCPNYRKK